MNKETNAISRIQQPRLKKGKVGRPTKEKGTVMASVKSKSYRFGSSTMEILDKLPKGRHTSWIEEAIQEKWEREIRK